MANATELTRFPVFQGLPEDQLNWFLSQSQEIALQSGESYLNQGDPADAMFVILEGQLQARGEIGGEVVMISTKPGDVGGILPFSRMKQFPLTARAITASRVLRFPAACFPDLIQDARADQPSRRADV